MKVFSLRRLLSVVCLTAIFFVSFANAAGQAAKISALQGEISSLTSSITKRKQTLAGQNAAASEEATSVAQEIKSIEKKTQRVNRKVTRAQERMSFVDDNISELNSWYNSLGAIEKGLNSSSYETKMDAYQADRKRVSDEVSKFNREKVAYEAELASLQQKSSQFQQASAAVNPNKDSQVLTLERKKAGKLAELAKLKARASSASSSVKAAVVPSAPAHSAYVFVISGKEAGKVERSLRLKKWVESYQAKYIEGNWNDLTGQDNANSGSMIKFLSQIEGELKSLPKSANLIFVGYGLGGGAVILAATEVAAKMNRKIDYLVAIDPMGPGGSRLNIVYKTSSDCYGRFEPSKYASCLQASQKRVIGSNVGNFYNRWQRESKLPIDAKDRVKVNNKMETLSTGKFLLANASIKSNQKRVFFDSEQKAHDLVLTDVASELPKLLVQYLR